LDSARNESKDFERGESLDSLHLTRCIEPTQFAAANDPGGREWIARLPALAQVLCERWELEIDRGLPRHGYNALVIPVRRHTEPLVLKLAWPAEGIRDEVHALKIWDGNGTVRMREADGDAGALLLERLDGDRTLRSLDALEAAETAGRLLRRLAIPAPPGFSDVRTRAGDTARSLRAQQASPDCPVPPRWLGRALELSRYLAAHAGTDLLIHADLHYDNVLAGTREPWLAIDPRPVAGEPEGAIPELLWTRIAPDEDDRTIWRIFETLIDSAGLNAERARIWVIVRCVDYWLWGVAHGLTHDPKRCRRILQALH
jgi:streptomycin 6-kinase